MLIIPFIAAAVLSFVLTLIAIKLAENHQVAMQIPRERDLHRKPISRLGGLAVVLSFLTVILVIAFLAVESWADFGFPYKTFGISIDKRLLGIILATIFISSVMFVDDVKGVPAYGKFAAQIVSALILIAAGVGITYLNNPFGLTIRLDSIKYPIAIGANVFHIVLWADLLFVGWVILLTNATNFIDGLDGLSGSLSFVAAVVLGAVSMQMGQVATAILAFVFAGAIFGFLYFNLPPAKIFLGDTGSMFLGLILAVLSFITGGKLATVFMVFALAILDAIYVIAKRLLRRQNPFTTTDQTHLHHRFLRAGLSRQLALFVTVLFSLSFGLSAIFLEPKLKIITIIGLTVLSFAMFIALDLKRKPERSAITEGE